MDAFNEMNKGASRQWEIMETQLKGVAIQIGTALMPALLKMVEIIAPLLTRLAEWIEANPKLTTILIATTAVLGGLLLTLGFLPGIIGTITAILPLMGAAFTIALGPIGLVVAAVAALVAGFAWLIGQNTQGPTVTMTNPETGEEFEIVAPGSLVGLQSFEHRGVVPGTKGMPIPVIAHGGEEYLGAGETVAGVARREGGLGGDVIVHTVAFIGDRAGVRKLWNIVKEEQRKDQRTQTGEVAF